MTSTLARITLVRDKRFHHYAISINKFSLVFIFFRRTVLIFESLRGTKPDTRTVVLNIHRWKTAWMETATAPTLGKDILLKIYSTMKTGILFKTFKALMLWINLQELYFLFRTFYLTSVTGLFIYLRDDVIVVYSYTPGAMWTSRNICQEYCYNLHLFVIYFFKFTGFELLLVWGGAKSSVSVKTYFSTSFYRFHSLLSEPREKSRQWNIPKYYNWNKLL